MTAGSGEAGRSEGLMITVTLEAAADLMATGRLPGELTVHVRHPDDGETLAVFPGFLAGFVGIQGAQEQRLCAADVRVDSAVHAAALAACGYVQEPRYVLEFVPYPHGFSKPMLTPRALQCALQWVPVNTREVQAKADQIERDKHVPWRGTTDMASFVGEALLRGCRKMHKGVAWEAHEDPAHGGYVGNVYVSAKLPGDHEVRAHISPVGEDGDAIVALRLIGPLYPADSTDITIWTHNLPSQGALDYPIEALLVANEKSRLLMGKHATLQMILLQLMDGSLPL